MSELLISVSSVEEAKLALMHGADIIDLKDSIWCIRRAIITCHSSNINFG